MKRLLIMLVLLTLAACSGQAEETVEPIGEETVVEPPDPASTLQVEITDEGEGVLPQPGDTVLVHYEGRLEDGTVFDSSYERGEPFAFTLGAGEVIQGWDQGIAQVPLGGSATLIIPPNLAYGDRGAGAVIPPDATLTFDVELVDINPVYDVEIPDTVEVPEGATILTTEGGAKVIILEQGDGPQPQVGDMVAVDYRGTLADGTEFDNSYDRGEPFSFTLGVGQVIQGWDQGIAELNEGSRAILVIPPELGYGSRGQGSIPPDAVLVFEVELVSVN